MKNFRISRFRTIYFSTFHFLKNYIYKIPIGNIEENNNKDDVIHSVSLV